MESSFTREFDMSDIRPRMPDEPGNHIGTKMLYPPEGSEVPATEIRFFEDGGFEIWMEGERVPASSFERTEEGEEHYEFSAECSA